MQVITVSTAFNIDLEFKIAAFGKRLGAWFIDLALIMLYFFIVFGFFVRYLGIDQDINFFMIYIIYILPVLLYQLFFEILMNGQTLGKKVMGIKVLSRDGQEATWGQYALRWMLCIGNIYIFLAPESLMNPAKLIGFLLLYVPDFLCVVVSNKSQKFGDLAAGTVVIDKSYVPDINQTIFYNISDTNYQPRYPQVMQLSDKDINNIKNLLNVAPTKYMEEYKLQIAQKLSQKWGIVPEGTTTDFYKQLIADYNYYAAKK